LSTVIPDVFLSSNDGMASGIIESLQNENVQNFPVITGQNAELLACMNIIKGRQSMTVYKSLRQEAETAAILAMKCARHEKGIQYHKKINNGKTDVASILISPQSSEKEAKAQELLTNLASWLS
jgi:D-xylose transport system substrate-binding protein